MKTETPTFRPALMLMSGRAAAFAATFFVPIVLVRVFTPAEFGTYRQFFLITYTLFAIGQLGLAESLYYFLPLNPGAAARYAANSIMTLSGIGILCLLGLAMNPHRIAQLINNAGIEQYVLLIGIYTVFMLMGTVLEITMISRKKFRWAATTYFVSDILRGVLLVIPALLTRSLTWTFIGGVSFTVLRVLTVLLYSRREFGSNFRFDAGLLRQQLSYAIPFAVAVVVQVIESNYHQYAVAAHFDAATFAIYSVGCLQIPLVEFMANPAANVMMVGMSEGLRDGAPRRLLPIWHDTTRKLALVFFPMVGYLVVNALPIITFLFTSNYSASAPIFMIWCLSIAATAFQTDGVLRVFAQVRFIFCMNIARLAVIVAFMGWFLARMHLIGAVTLAIIGILVAKSMGLVRIKSLLQVSFGGLLPWRNLGGIFVAAMLSAIGPAILNAKVGLPALYQLPLSGAVYTVTYTVLIWTAGLLTENEKAAMKRSLYVWNRRARESGREAGL